MNLIVVFVIVFLMLCVSAAVVYIPRNEQFRELDRNLPNIVIKKAYYINMDKSTERRDRFIRGYNGRAPLERVSGVKVEKKVGRLGIGTRGCSLAHAKAMNEIAGQPDGWYLVCEDDCVGDFSTLEENIILRNIIHRTSKQFINIGRWKWTPYSLSDINFCTQAYLITPKQAAKTRDAIHANIDGPKALAVDELIIQMYRTPRFFGQSGDKSGCHVALLDAVGPSDITAMGR